MKAEITLNLRTREVYKLFERKISGDRLFIEAILRKMNGVVGGCRKQDPLAIKSFHQIENQLKELTNEFGSEVKRYEGLLSKKKEFKGKEINIVVQFLPKIAVSNTLSLLLAEFIESYDKLIAILKLLRLAGCFESEGDYFVNLRQVQKAVNRALSGVIFI